MLIKEKIVIYNRTSYFDERGLFVKIITGNEQNLPHQTGEVYVTIAKPGFSKGSHYHLNANEWFTLIKGKSKLLLIDIDSQEKLELILDSEQIKTIFVPKRIAHCFQNISDEDFILAAYTDLLYDPSDTIPYDCL